jgi:ABC-type amino acid transport substrate-binding protein
MPSPAAAGWPLGIKMDARRTIHRITPMLRSKPLFVAAGGLLLQFALALAPALALALTLAPDASAQTARPVAPDKTLRVATRVLEPLVVQRGNSLSGFSIDVWNEVARRAGLKSEFVIVGSVKAMLDAVESGDAQAAVAAISMTPEREQRVDFSHMYLQSGLQIMTPIHQASWLDSMGHVSWADVLGVVALVALLIALVAHVIWLIERGRNPEFPKEYLRGVGEGLWWAVVTVVTVGYGDRTPKRVWGRIVAAIWMFAGIFLIAHLTATITSRLTVESLQGQINGLNDLPGKRVVTVEGTTASQYLRANGIVHLSVGQISDAFAQIETGRADALIYDAPVLNHYANTQGKGKVRMAGVVFKAEPYGIALQQDSPYRKAINQAILEIFSDGTHERLTRKWFGTD